MTRFLRRVLILWLLGQGCVAAAMAQDVLVYRPLDNSDVVATKAEIVFELEITAFTTIRKVTVNGVEQPISPGTFATVRMPAKLHPGMNHFDVRVVTDAGAVQKAFEIQLVDQGQAEPEKKNDRFTWLATWGYSMRPILWNCPSRPGPIPQRATT